MADYNNNSNDVLYNEYNDFEGLDNIGEQEDLLGRIWKNPQKRRQLVRKVFNTRLQHAGGQSTSRDDFQKRFKQLPEETKQGLLNKQKQLVDTAFYVVKDISNSKIVKMLKDDDNKVVAMSNISGGKLEKENFFTLKGIQLLYGVAGLQEDFKNVNFRVLPDFIRNGEFEFTANGSILIPAMSCEVFNTTRMSNIRMGYFELVNPKMIEPQQPMDLEVEWESNAPERTWMKVVLIGTSVAKY